jgi:hypothetical protein
MISYHIKQFNNDKKYGYSHGWNYADTSDMARIANCITRFVWSPIVFKFGHRNQDNFLGCDLFVLDFEDERYDLKRAVDDFKDFSHVIGTTRNHQIEKDGKVIDRFRVVIKAGEVMNDVEVYRYNMKLIVKNFPCDRKCTDGARLFYPCKEIVSIRKEGLSAVVEKPKSETIVSYQAYYDAGMLTPFLRKLVKGNGVSIGKRNITAYGAFIDLKKLGRSQAEAFEFVLNHIYNGIADNALRKEIRATMISAWKH